VKKKALFSNAWGLFLVNEAEGKRYGQPAVRRKARAALALIPGGAWLRLHAQLR
jgi:hypothetical protein